jgi:hypothetical protein
MQRAADSVATGFTNAVVDSAEIFQIASSLRRLQFASQPAGDLLGINKAGLIAFWTLRDGRTTAARRLGKPHWASATWTIAGFGLLTHATNLRESRV